MRLTDGPTCLRRLNSADLSAFQAYRSDPRIARYQSWEQLDDVRAAGFLAHMQSVSPLLQPGEWTQIGVEAGGELIGDMGWYLGGDRSWAEIGITLSPGHHGAGHGLRATRLATDFIFQSEPVERIRVWARVQNSASRRLAERAGFAFVGFETNDGVDEAAYALDRPVG